MWVNPTDGLTKLWFRFDKHAEFLCIVVTRLIVFSVVGQFNVVYGFLIHLPTPIENVFRNWN